MLLYSSHPGLIGPLYSESLTEEHGVSLSLAVHQSGLEVGTECVQRSARERDSSIREKTKPVRHGIIRILNHL